FEGNGACRVQDLALDAAGNLNLTGSMVNTVDFDPGAATLNLTSNGNNDVFVCQLDAAGNLNWAKNFGGSGSDEAYDLDLDAQGNVYVTGIFRETVDFDPGPGIVTALANGGTDAFLTQLSPQGNLVRVKVMGGTGNDFGEAVQIAGNGDHYWAGTFSATTDMDPGAGVSNLVSAGGTDAFLTKLDSNGDFV
ncbi:MAG: hypothetical protein AAF570_23325, partial [Bacteroidota bacterium]